MLPSRPFHSIALAVLVLFGGAVGVDATVGASSTAAMQVETAPLRNARIEPAGFEAAAITATRRSELSDEQQFVDKINELRVGLGLEPLTVHPTLVPLARDWADHLRSQGALSHAPDLSVGVTEEWSRLGENVGVGPAGEVQALFDAFVASPSHYANLIKPDYRYIGVGVVYGGDGRIWTAHRFMALASGASGAPASPATSPTTPPTTAAPTTNTSSTVAPPTNSTSPPRASAISPPTAPPSTSTAADAENEDQGEEDQGERIRAARSAVAPALVKRIAADLELAGI